tara:strand:- start:8362 stop:9078 length:717 start_codon:yes stop_codon:yes gene_type:complete
MVMENLENGIKIGSREFQDVTIARMGWLLPSIIAPLSMLIHLISGHSRDFPIFISESDYPGIERWIFTIGLSCAGIIQMLFAYRMWYTMRGDGRRKLMHWALGCGLFTGLNLIIMSFANMYDYLSLHVLTASNVFQFGILWALLAHLSLPKANSSGRKIRISGMMIAFISFIIMTQSIIKAVDEVEEFGLEGDTIFTLHSIQSVVDLAVYAEYGLFIGLILALYSFEVDFRDKLADSE